MIANNSTNKLKASKGFRESDSIKLLVSEEKARILDRGEGDKDRHYTEHQSKSSYSSSVVYSRDRSLKPRSRHRDDYRIVRGTTERRGGSSRGRGAHRKIDKDGEVFIPRGKFQEPLTKGRSSDGVTISSSKYDVEGGKSKSADFGSYISLPEDSRISKVLRRMSREDEGDKFIQYCNQLQEAIVAADNARYIRRALDLICDSLLDMLHSGPNSEAKLHAAKCLGRLGHTLDQDFKRFMEWVFPNYTVERNDDVKGLLLKAVLETVRLEREQPRLKDFAPALMSSLHMTLEAVDKAQLLIVAAEVLLNLASIYPDVFKKYFTDTVDILVGWHIDLTTPPSVACYASQSLQRLSPHWIEDIEFALTMLDHLLEDIENYAEELTETEPSSPADSNMSRGLSNEDKITKVTAFIKVFNAVMKGLKQHLSPSMSPSISWSFLYDCLQRMLAVILKMINITINFELIITGNECTWLLLNLLQNKTCPAHEDLYQLLDIEINLMDQLPNIALASTLQLIAKVVKELSANLPLELVQRILKPGSSFLDLRFSPCKNVHNGIVSIYHSLLSLKNIPLLKEAYRLILTDLDCAFRVILPDLSPLCMGIEPIDCNVYDTVQCEDVVLFHLKALSDIANASNSLIGMWVLHPSILDLLATRMIPQSIGRVRSSLFYTELYLLYSHCSRHSHFITTSSLMGGTHGRPSVNSLLGIPSSEPTQLSPTSGHLSVILTLLSNILTEVLSEECVHLVLTWCCELLSQSRPYFTSLASTSEMCALVAALCATAEKSFSTSVLLDACANLEQLLIAPYTLYWKKPVLERIADLCLLHVNSRNSAVAARYSALLLRLPWTINLPILIHGVAKQGSVRMKLNQAQHTLITQDTNTGEMTSHDFKTYMAYLLQGVKSGSLEWLGDLFTSCWSLSQCEPHDYNSVRETALTSLTVLLQWATWESAQLCVNSKLRTPLGKPLDTFMAFEGAIKALARQTIASTNGETLEQFNVSRVRLLLELVEQLEKAMYNASDGTATALISPAKPVRTFFHTNKSTCCEWLSRNRSALVGVSLHVGMATTAVRHGYALLQDLLDLGNTKSPEFENAVLQTAWALLQLRQSEAIHGLYVWCRDIIGVKLPYLKALADQAAGKLEVAVASYTKLINNESLDSPTRLLGLVPSCEHDDGVGQSVKTLLADQITECYLALQDWTQLARWKSREPELLANQNGGTTSRYIYMTPKDAEAYLEYEREDWSAANELLEWSTETENMKPSWNCYQLLGTTRHKLSNIAIKSVANGIIQDSDRDILRECQAAAHCYFVEGLRNTPSEVVQEAAILEFAANAMLSESDVILDCPTDGNIKHKLSSVDSTLLARILWWGQTLERLQITSQPSPQLSLDAARLARKEGNLKLSLRKLSHHLNQILHQDNGHRTTLVLTDDILEDMNKCAQPWTLPQAKAFSEVSKLLYSVGQHELAVSVGVQTCMKLMDVEELEVKDRCSRLLLSVAKWLPPLDPTVVPHITEPLVDWHRETDISLSLLDIPADFNLEEDPVGTLLQLAVSHCPSLAKGWTSLANWSYRWGRKVNDQVFTPADKEIIDTLIPTGIDKEKVYNVLTYHAPPVDDDDDIEVENLNVSDMIEWQLQGFGSFSPEQLASLVDLWRKSHARTYNFYQLSAYSYFKYLELCPNPQEDSHAITATLRLLRLIVKHAQELQSVLEVGLATTPSLPWVCIIPQLFSRLSHPQTYVRRRVSELLCRLAADKPHLIIFPSVVGSDAGAATIRDMPHTKLFSTSKREVLEDLDIVEEEEEEFEDDEDDSHNGEETQAMENCFQAMVDILAKQDAEAITQVQVFVRELRRITLLWDELWLGTLAQHHADMSRRVTCLEQEVTRVDENPDLTTAEKDRLVAEKHRIMLKPLLFVLEQLHAITSVPAETPHEIWFQEKFEANIAEVLEKLQNPADPRKPGDAWSALKGLQYKLQQRVTKRSSYSLRMKDISPTLAAMKNTQISMPGMRSVLTIAAIQDHIAVLPTKTKPKKLVFQGSDGKSYTYLFKGLEDLHLDERIMQFLSIANTMLRGAGPGLQARHYAVIPLGLRSGLISWVQGVTPLFSLYKRWQQRQASINQSTVMRPSELFYSKLTPLLKDCDVTKPESRNTWPLAVLKQVLMELMQETPTYLLSRELWCDSVNAGGWWQSTKLFSTSLAVMSIIGYIIGLGDRHLDNVLVDLTTGQVVHIDYNVCFEKGKSLRVPEKVPFRLTPNLRAALGVTGVEGIFRLTCEQVLKVMKKGRETVLTLLEAFVYDPLIDWTPGSETGYTGAVYGGGRAVALETRQSRKQLEKEVTVDMLAVRLTEMRHEWLDNRDKLVVELPDLGLTLQKWLNESSRLKKAEEALQERHQQMALVKEAEAHSQHALYSLPVRYASNCAATEASTKARSALQVKQDECARSIQQYKMALYYFYGPQMAQWLAEVNARSKHDTYLVFDLIKEFLQNAGQGQMVLQCIQSEKELCELCLQQTQLTRASLDLLEQYAAVVRYFPMSHVNHHRTSLYHRWATTLLDNFSVESCDLVLSEVSACLTTPQLAKVPLVVSYNLALQRLLAEGRVGVSKLLERVGPPVTEPPPPDTAAPTALHCVVVTALCNLNKRFLMLESAAKSAMECLVDLTSQKGEWFFDEMCLTVGIMMKLLSLLPASENDSPLHIVFKCLHAAHSQYKTLQELNLNFTSIILPEAVQKIHMEDPSVLAMVAELDAIIASVQMPLPELVAQLQRHLHFVILGLESPHAPSQEVARQLQVAVDGLVQQSGDTLTPGQMLFMGFNGLFVNLAMGSSNLVTAFATLNTPAVWKTIDQLRDARMLAAPVHDPGPRAVLDSIFLVKRLQAMQELFAMCRANVEAFKGLGVTLPCDDDRFHRPIRCFTADYVSSQMLGVFSQTVAITTCYVLQQIGLNVTGEVEQREVGAESRVPLEDLCRVTIDQCLRQGEITSASLSQASGAVQGVESSVRAALAASRRSQELARAEAAVLRIQNQLTAHWWFHEDILASAQVAPPPTTLNRQALMLELRKMCATLMSIQPRLLEAHEQQNALVASAEQRLKWAAGANPALSEVMCAFETSVNNNNEQLVMEQRLANLVAGIGNSVLHYEAWRTHTSDAINNDSAFVQLVERSKQSCLLYQNLNTQLTPLEESLVKICPPDSQIDWNWIAKAESLISDSVKTLMQQMEPQKVDLFAAFDAIKSKALTVRSLLTTQYRIMADVRSLLKTMVKFEEPGVAEYLTCYRAYTERLSTLIKTIMGMDEFTPEKAQNLLQEIVVIQEETPGIYEEFLQLGKGKEGESKSASKRPPLLRQDSVCLSPKRDPHTGKAVQERNAYAVSVWRRVRWKLEGKDPDPARKYTVQEQVDWAINEATSLDNLALLYEGWTPWV